MARQAPQTFQDTDDDYNPSFTPHERDWSDRHRTHIYTCTRTAYILAAR
jgi:hypothetical protein